MPTRLDVTELFLKSYALFRTNLQQFMLFGVVSALLGGIVQFIPDSTEVIGVVKGFLSLAMALVQIWITIALILVVNSKLLGEELDSKEALIEGKEFYGNYFITNLLFGLRILVIAFPVMLVFTMGNNVVLYIVAGIIAILGLSYVLIHYSFAPIMRILNPEVDTPFATSFSLAKAYRLEIFIIFIFVGLLTVSTQLSTYFDLVPNLLGIGIQIVTTAFIFPITTIVTVILYHFLVNQYHAKEETETSVDKAEEN